MHVPLRLMHSFRLFSVYFCDSPPTDTNLSISLTDIGAHLVRHNFDQTAFLASPALDAAEQNHGVVKAIPSTSTVGQVMNHMVGHEGEYRFHVLNEGENAGIKGIVSQFDLVRFVYEHRWQLIPAYGDALLRIPHIGTDKPPTVPESISAREAMRTLFIEKKRNAVAVVDGKGAMQAYFDARCIRELSFQHRPDFDKPLKTFEIVGRDPGWVVPEHTLEEVLKRIVDNRLHRVWVINDVEQPVKIITLSDILRYTMDVYREREQEANK